MAKKNPAAATAEASSDAEVKEAPVVAEADQVTPEQERADVQRRAKERARERAKAAVGRYRVTLGDVTGEYDARDRNEAWAMFCDAHKHWPSPKYSQRTIEKLAEPTQSAPESDSA